jgi:hypothetical protein
MAMRERPMRKRLAELAGLQSGAAQQHRGPEVLFPTIAYFQWLEQQSVEPDRARRKDQAPWPRGFLDAKAERARTTSRAELCRRQPFLGAATDRAMVAASIARADENQ